MKNRKLAALILALAVIVVSLGSCGASKCNCPKFSTEIETLD